MDNHSEVNILAIFLVLGYLRIQTQLELLTQRASAIAFLSIAITAPLTLFYRPLTTLSTTWRTTLNF